MHPKQEKARFYSSKFFRILAQTHGNIVYNRFIEREETKMMTKKQMAKAIAEKWERESKLSLGIEWRTNDLMKRHGWHSLHELYEKEIG